MFRFFKKRLFAKNAAAHPFSLFPRGVRLIAHRGIASCAPENTVASFIAAGKEKDIFGIESDVHRTGDGAFVMIHDDSTRRVAERELKIRASQLSELRALTLHMPDGTRSDAWRIPTLEEYLSVCREYHKAAFIELKYGLSDEDIRALAAAVRAAGYLSHTAFISFTLSYLVTLRELLPGVPLFLLTAEAPEHTLRTLVRHGIGIDLLWEAYTPETAKRIKKYALPTGVFTVNDPALLRRMSARGATYITTDTLRRTTDAVEM